MIRAPLTGVVSSREVNRGDVVSPGTALFTVIDPSSMRLEASVPSDDLSALRVGAKVEFTVRGYDQTFPGTIERIAPQADAATRQVPIYVAIPNVGGRLVAGLYAEGRVVSQSASGLVVPLAAINTTRRRAVGAAGHGREDRTRAREAGAARIRGPSVSAHVSAGWTNAIRCCEGRPRASHPARPSR